MDAIVPSARGVLSVGLLALKLEVLLTAASPADFPSAGCGLENLEGVGGTSSFSCSIGATTAESVAGGGFASARGGSSWGEGASVAAAATGTLEFFSPSTSGKSLLAGVAATAVTGTTATSVFSPSPAESFLAGNGAGGGALLPSSGSFSSSSRRLAPLPPSQPVSRAISVDPASLSRAPSSGLLPRSQELLDHRLNNEDLADGFSAPASGDEASSGGVAVPENAFFLFSPAHCVQDEIYAVAFEGAFSTSGDAGAAEVARSARAPSLGQGR